MTGYHATIAVEDPGGCPVALAAERADSTVSSVSRSSTRDAETVVEEFTVRDPDGALADGLGEPTGMEAATAIGDRAARGGTGGASFTPVAETERERTYRFSRDWSTDCVCEVVEGAGNPVSSLRAEDGALHVTVNASDFETLSRTVGDLKAQFEGVNLRELTERDGRRGAMAPGDRG